MTKDRSIVTGKMKEGGSLFGMGKVGALTIPVIKGWESSEAACASEQNFMFSIYDADDIYSMCREAGFAENPETGFESQETLAIRYTGAEPSIADAKDIPASKCWLMIQFGIAHADYLEAERQGDFRGVMEAGYILGRLTEWWRWRSKKHDAEAVSRQASSAELKTSTANDDRKFVADEWKAEARAAANRIRERNPRLKSKKAIAERVIKELSADDPTFIKSTGTVRKVI